MLVIRDAIPQDKAAVLSMMKDFYDSPACLHTVPEENFLNTFREALSGNPSVRLLILEEQNEKEQNRIQGYANIILSWNNEAGGPQIWLDELYVKDSARGKGFGTQVFQWIQKEYPEIRRIRLEVTKENTRAVSLYQKLGYQELPYYQMCKDL